MTKPIDSIQIQLTPEDNVTLQNFCGWHEEHITFIETRLGLEINHLGHQFRVSGDPELLSFADQVLRDLYRQSARGMMTTEKIHLYLTEHSARLPTLAPSAESVAVEPVDVTAELDAQQEASAPVVLVSATPHFPEAVGAGHFAVLKPRRKTIRARSENQDRYVRAMQSFDINFGIGPAGTGKTYMAVARAVELLENNHVRRLVLTRPAVEAGEKLGFLPGDLAQKVDPYLRPLYDALYELLGYDQVERLMERNVIEVAPLAFMRGRTLNESCIILDEAQNTTLEQMKMFLTRVGFGSKVMITGDVTQIDLPNKTNSGLRQAIEILKDVEGIGFSFFTAKDVVRHPLVQRVIEAYEQFETKTE